MNVSIVSIPIPWRSECFFTNWVLRLLRCCLGWLGCWIVVFFGAESTKFAQVFTIFPLKSLQNWRQGGTWRLLGAFGGPRGEPWMVFGSFFGLRIFRWHGFGRSLGVPWGLLGHPWGSQEGPLRGLMCKNAVKVTTFFKAFFHTPFQEGQKCENRCFT